jgi:hypothetical protein
MTRYRNILAKTRIIRRRRRHFRAPWTPAALGPSLALWFDAADTSTITLNGSNVSQWNDKSGNARNFAQATAASQPAYLPTGYNGRPTLQTDGADFLERGASGLGRNVSGLTCALVGLHASGAAFSGITGSTEFFISSNVSTATRFALVASTVTISPSGRYGIAGRRSDGDTFAGAASSTDAAANRGNPFIRIGQRAYSAGVANHWTNGSQDVTNATIGTQGAGDTSATDATRSLIFQGIDAMPNGSQISEIVFTHSIMSNEDRQNVEGYLAWKWGGL